MTLSKPLHAVSAGAVGAIACARFPSFLRNLQEFTVPGLQVPRVLQRLTTFAARFETSTQLGDAEAVLRQHLVAQAELRTSPCFAAALQLALAIGNFMNWGTRLGQAAGFRLKNLPKLQVRP